MEDFVGFTDMAIEKQAESNKNNNIKTIGSSTSTNFIESVQARGLRQSRVDKTDEEGGQMGYRLDKEEMDKKEVEEESHESDNKRSHSYAQQLKKSLPSTTIIEEGVPLDTLEKMSHRLPSLLKQHDPLVVVILGGVHDLKAQNTTVSYEGIMSRIARLHKMALSHPRQDGKKVVTMAITLPPVEELTEEEETIRLKVNTGIVKLATHHSRTFVCDLAALTQFSFANKYSPFWASDAFHLSATGYDVLGKLVLNTMLESKIGENSLRKKEASV